MSEHTTTVQKSLRPKILGLFAVCQMNYRRWRHFLTDRTAVASLWIVGVIFLVSLFADLIANDKPLLVQYKGEYLFPLVVDYPETKFGGFLGRTDYRDPFVEEEILANGWMIYPIVPYHFHRVVLDEEGSAPHPPNSRHWLGTDDQGRDMLSRLIHGIRISFIFGFIYVIITSAIGIAVGAAQGYFGGWLDLLLQRVLEVYGSIPTFFVLIILSGLLTPNFWLLMFILVVFGWPGLVGVVRLEFLKGRNLDYVRAAKAMGVSDPAIMWRHVFPNAMIGPVTILPFALASSVTVLSSLDFLGFGLPSDSPSLGEMARQAFNNREHAWWIMATVFGGLGGLTVLMVFIGNGVRNALDPRVAFVSLPDEPTRMDTGDRDEVDQRAAGAAEAGR